MELHIKTRGTTSVEVEFEPALARIHVLDLDRGGTTVTNSIEDIQPEILRELGLREGSESEYTWILYHTDGVATRFDGSFHHVDLYDPILISRFREILSTRR